MSPRPPPPSVSVVLATFLAACPASAQTSSVQTGTVGGFTAYVSTDAAFDVARRKQAVRQDIARAKAGDLVAQYALGMRLIRGDDVIRNPAKGALWLKDAADAGSARSQFRMGQILARGLCGMKRDRLAALRYLDTAARSGIPRAKKLAARLRTRTPAPGGESASGAVSGTERPAKPQP